MIKLCILPGLSWSRKSEIDNFIFIDPFYRNRKKCNVFLNMFLRKSKFAWMTCHEGYDGIFWRSNPNPNALLRSLTKIIYDVVSKLSWQIKLFIFNTYVVTKHHGFDMPLLIWSVNKMRKCGKLDPILQYQTKIVQKFFRNVVLILHLSLC